MKWISGIIFKCFLLLFNFIGMADLLRPPLLSLCTSFIFNKRRKGSPLKKNQITWFTVKANKLINCIDLLNWQHFSWEHVAKEIKHYMMCVCVCVCIPYQTITQPSNFSVVYYFEHVAKALFTNHHYHHHSHRHRHYYQENFNKLK